MSDLKSVQYEEAAPMGVGSYVEIGEWMSGPGSKSRRHLSRSNIPALMSIYGEPDGAFHGSGRDFDLWRQEFGGRVFWIVSAEGDGCSYEIEASAGQEPWVQSPADRAETVGVIEDFLTAHLAKLDAALGLAGNIEKAKKPKP